MIIKKEENSNDYQTQSLKTVCVSIYYKWLLVEASTIYAKIKMGKKKKERKHWVNKDIKQVKKDK